MLKGIDISSWQTGIDLSVVPCDFVIIKATQGLWDVEKTCDGFYQQCKKHGILRGVYHYAEGGNAIEEADFFVENCLGYIGDAILCLDWESIDNPTFGSGNDWNWCKAWLDRVYQKTGVRPLLYFSASCLSWFKNIGDYGFWVAQYADDEATGYQDNPWNENEYNCAIRQYSSHGQLPGYNGWLDLDKAYMDREAWGKYACPDEHCYIPVPPTAIHNAETAPQIYIVKEGDTLSEIAERYNLDYRTLALMNGIENPDLIYVGQIIKIY